MKNILGLLLCFFISKSYSQELKFTVQITTEQMKSASNGAVNVKDAANIMQQEISSFLNSRIWTSDKFAENEKIKCYLVINITEVPDQNSYKANAQLQVSRPVYGASYETLVLNYIDSDFDFSYPQGMQLNNYNDNSFSNNITSLLAFYAYLSLGFDYDSFSKNGGSPYFEKAQNVVNNAQQSGNLGWKSVESQNNKYWLMENLNSPQMQAIREGLFAYHRNGLDNFIKDPTAARASMIDCLNKVKKAAEFKPGAILIRTFFKTKDSELISIFTEATTDEKQKVYDVARQLDPSSLTLYDKMMK